MKHGNRWLKWKAGAAAISLAIGVMLTGCSSTMPDKTMLQTAETIETEIQTEETAIEETIPENMIVYDYANMTDVLAAVVITMNHRGIHEMQPERADNAFAVEYIYSYANLSGHEMFQIVDMDGTNHHSYMQIDKAYMESFLINAFGENITPDNLEADGDLLLSRDGEWFAALDQIPYVSVDYSGLENIEFKEKNVYSFNYTISYPSGDTEDGIVQVHFRESDRTEYGIILDSVAIAEY